MFGSPDNQWWGSIFPRLHVYVPVDRILEIAPGFGRWTHYLKNLCQELVLVELSEICIQECKNRFSSSSHITYHVNDGKSLDVIPDKSIDFCFSFDSLVHVEDDVVEEYIRQLARKLKPNGVAFIHHSNLGEHRIFSILSRMEGFSRYSKRMVTTMKRKLGLNTGWRAMSMTAKKFEQFVEKVKMQTISQEKINWENSYFTIDCISVFTPKGSIWDRPNRLLVNRGFMAEARCIKKLSKLYATP